MVTAAELLQMAHSLARQQPPPGPAQPQPQPARDGDEEGGSDDDGTEVVRRTEAEGAQQGKGKRKGDKQGAGCKERRKQARRELQWDAST
jgi:hypothetical protein